MQIYCMMFRTDWLGSASPPTMGSGDPSSGHICNTVSKYWSFGLNKTSLCWDLTPYACAHILVADWTMVASIRLQQLAALAETDGWGDTQGSVPQLVRPLQTPDPRPTSCTSFFAGPAVHGTSVLGSVCTSRVGAGVDWQVLGYSPQDLLLGLFPILPLQQLFVRVRQMKLCGAEHTKQSWDLLTVTVDCV